MSAARPFIGAQVSEPAAAWRPYVATSMAGAMSALTLIVTCLNSPVFAQSSSNSSSNSFIDLPAAAKLAYMQQLKRYQSAPGQIEAAWHFARACYDLADFATNNAERALIAEKGITACRSTLAEGATSAPMHYYLGMNLAQSARTKTLGALKIVRQMETEFKTVRDLDEHFDYAGADRNLGLLYRDAPSFGSIGSRTKAREHLQRAVDLAPEDPENRLNLIEAYLQWNERDNARQELERLTKLWPAAREKLTGPAWVGSWIDWDQRLAKVQKKLGK